MPEFLPGEEKIAVVPMTNPTAKAFDYLAELYMGTNLALTARKDFHLEAGEEKDISLPIIMPSVVGTYPVYIGVFSGGVSIGLYKAVEDVVIIEPIALPFTFSDVSAERVVMVSSPAWDTIVFNCLVTNPNDIITTERLNVKYEYTYADGTKKTLGLWAFDLILAAKQSYNFKWNGNTYGQRKPGTYNGPIIGVGCSLCMWLQDQLGNSSGRGCV